MDYQINELTRKTQLVFFLESICQKLELTPTQYDDAKQKYESVAKWIGESSDERISNINIYPQGSMRLETTVKPIGQDEFDIDLMSHLSLSSFEISSKEVNRLIGDRLREHKTYKEMLVPLNRGWRLDYANEFHLDITPCINDVTNWNGSVLVPDREQKEWKQSNPKGYAKLFEIRSELQPTFLIEESLMYKANIESLPEPRKFKGILKRSVQLLKRHRDIYFAEKNSKLAPISIIITTLASKAYEKCVNGYTYTNELDILTDILKHMDEFIKITKYQGRSFYEIPNETSEGENFAEKWNLHPERAESYFEWRTNALENIEEMINTNGLDMIGERLSKSFGQSVAKLSMESMTNNVNIARKSQSLFVASGLGLSTNAGAEIKPNTFFGK
jgi:hypothetical protein